MTRRRTDDRHRGDARGLARRRSNLDAARPQPQTERAHLLVRRRARPGRQPVCGSGGSRRPPGAPRRPLGRLSSSAKTPAQAAVLRTIALPCRPGSMNTKER